ncbi:uncharacterized protein LOC122031576 [Zingiber officinale]|uniref:uncharacterized protein LOC122031576 n=1 Tax=Zingiber officinale TaxID=94328 RepID=UPI001C4ABCD0|nr:uncharacterized protein LOC122031576 [Zingiber officinale]
MEDSGLRSSERSSLVVQAKAASLPAPGESLLSRLDQFDLRLRQLEETHRLLLPAADCYFTADLHLLSARHAGGKHSRSTSLSTMHDLELKDALLDRLHSLETRIRQLSLELDKDIGGGGTSKTPSVGSAINGGSAPLKTVARAEKNESRGVWSWRTGVLLKGGARELPSQKPTIKVKELEKAVGAAEKAVGATFQNQRRRAERARLYRRWLTVGC